ncbi:MAG TPA: GNAT family protein [Fulvivirga sp.]|nr:GNAT family protein [Fulvivirga sp.]
MDIGFKRLTQVSKSSIIELMNNPLVRRQMPLLIGDFNENDYNSFIAAKEKLWNKYGYGPWAFIVNGHFAGWGGLQKENGEADLAIVLHPNYWGIGKIIYDKIMKMAFNDMKLKSVTVLFPPTRTRIKGLIRLGFKEAGELMVGNNRFIRYRILNTAGSMINS